MKLPHSIGLCVAFFLWGLSVAFSTLDRSTLTAVKRAVNSRTVDALRMDIYNTITASTDKNVGALSSKRRRRMIFDSSLSSDSAGDAGIDSSTGINNKQAGKLESLKLLEVELAAQLALVRREKLATIRSRPLTIGVVGFGRFGQFIAKTFAKYGNVVVTSRSDYTDIATTMGAKYIPLAHPEAFLAEGLDVIVLAVSILSFDETIQFFAPHLRKSIQQQQQCLVQSSSTVTSLATSPLHGPLIVDVLSVKEHARSIMLRHLPAECDILCTHPMFGPDSGKDGWYNLNFVYEKTRVDKVLIDPNNGVSKHGEDELIDDLGGLHSVHEDSEAHVEGMDRMERFLSIWEEEGCRMVPLSCRDHDAYAANSQFITHLVGRVLGSQGLAQTPIDTSGFQSVLKLVDSTTADSFDLFYGLYKYNQNSVETIKQLQAAMEDVVQNLKSKEAEENNGKL